MGISVLAGRRGCQFGAVKQISTQVVNSQGEATSTIAIGSRGIQALTGIFPINTDIKTGEIYWRHLRNVNPKFANILDTMVRYDFRQRYPTAHLALQALKTLSTSTSSQVPNTLIANKPKPIAKPKNILIASGIAGVIAISVAILPHIINSSQIKVADFSTYEQSNLGITIKYPQSWQRQDIDNIFTKEVVTFLSPLQDKDKFQEKVILSVEDYSGSLNQSKNDFTKEIKERLSAAKIIQVSSTTLAYKPAFQIIYTGKDEEKDLKLKNWQIWTLQSNKAYIITYTAQQEEYDKFIPAVEEIIKSFEIKN